MKYGRFSRKKGLTLVELLIAMAIMGIVIVGAFQMFRFGDYTFKGGTNQYDLQSDARRLVEAIESSVRYASNVDVISGTYNPSDFTNPVGNTFFGYNYIYLETNPGGETIIRKLVYDVAAKTYKASELALSGTSAKIFGLSFKYDGTMALEFNLKVSEGKGEYSIGQKVAIMNSTLGSPRTPVVGTAFRYKPTNTALKVNTPPTAAPVDLSGIEKVGQILTGSYYYYDEDGDGEQGTVIKWYRRGSSTEPWAEIPGASGSTAYTITSSDLGKVICFEVIPKAATGVIDGISERSTETDAVVAANVNINPKAKYVYVSGVPKKNNQLFVSYTYYDAENDPEGASVYTWYRANLPGEVGSVVQNGGKLYDLKQDDYNKFIYFTVVPKDTSGRSGKVIKSNIVGPIDRVNAY